MTILRSLMLFLSKLRHGTDGLFFLSTPSAQSCSQLCHGHSLLASANGGAQVWNALFPLLRSSCQDGYLPRVAYLQHCKTFRSDQSQYKQCKCLGQCRALLVTALQCVQQHTFQASGCQVGKQHLLWPLMQDILHPMSDATVVMQAAIACKAMHYITRDIEDEPAPPCHPELLASFSRIHSPYTIGNRASEHCSCSLALSQDCWRLYRSSRRSLLI
ncbi:TPA: hypothetical protein ACH3X1_010846 [Trebouxia sp. C0004]